MVEVSDEQFQELINLAMTELPGEHVKNIENVAILYEDLPTQEQMINAGISGPNQTLLGLYEGVPLTKRQGMTRTFPDKITLFKQPLQWRANSVDELKEEIKHTIWHEVAHYYGLDHKKIRELE